MLFAKSRASLRQRFRHRRDRWIARRHPPVHSEVIDKRRIYILPTAACAGFVLLLLVLMLLAINYENNLVYGLTFLLVGVLLVSMVHTHNNLRGIRLSARGSDSVFAGEKSRYRLHLKAPEHAVVGVSMQYEGGDEFVLTLDPEAERTVELSAASGERGLHRPGILRLVSRYPMGLFVAWSYVNLDQHSWIYPRPEVGGTLPASAMQSDTGALLGEGTEEFSGLNEYQPGMPLGRVAWATLARGLPLQVKEFSDIQGEARWLRWSFWPELGGEARLSRLCHWVLKLERENKAFGLELPARRLEIGAGRLHAEAALLALAQQGVKGPQ
ncbi:MAG TPA: DUF58 domain-containing protein [Marinobacterium sp.]|nr:DUF58 domain-containing protein [Marinobacterium sp.]